ncbi:hypothetical protein [Parvibaculum sp.]|jgi:predicted RNase H-like HicB family nuclease|uniref:hypothetical protein n=1 Tax=Parvibaculum sp. TaxID=2024848 RepID=UPI000C5FE9DB|nr:hypothetical protein [Parvibaculum sp.]MAM94081.1 hypothetical protein [Parvibaculum sp.]HCX66965.1 hypothetical protein [Rhodobiaceae bacterium]|tara:strand:- start:242 stop:493 length:252 start_codon:yes stop_codon:yes gene_type:complete
MSKDGHHVYLGVTDSGTYVAATDSSPYFCFEGTTEGEVEEKAQKAFRFYLRVKGSLVPDVRVGVEARLSKVVRRKVLPLDAVA